MTLLVNVSHDSRGLRTNHNECVLVARGEKERLIVPAEDLIRGSD